MAQTFAKYRVKSCQSGQTLFLGDDPVTGRADCVTFAAAESLLRPNEQLCVVPENVVPESNRPPLTFDQLQALAANVRRQTVIADWS